MAKDSFWSKLGGGLKYLSPGAMAYDAYNNNQKRQQLQDRINQIQQQQAQQNLQQQQGQFPGTTPIGLINQSPQGDWWNGTPESSLIFQKLFPNQQFAQNSALQQAMQGLQNTPLDFGPLKERYLKEFGEQTLPGILESYGAGRMTGERSSAFPQILGRAYTDLNTNLGGLESQYNLAKHGLLQSLLGLGLTPQVESIYSPAQGGFKQGLAKAGGEFIGKLPELATRAFVGV